MAGRETYDIPSKQLEAIKWKDARRRLMRERYHNYLYNPHVKGEMFDEAIQRWTTSKVCYDYIFKPSWKNFMFAIGVTVVPMVFFYKVMKKQRDGKEHLYRTGQVSYADRDKKFGG